MNKEQLNKFKQEIYEPYHKAWEVISSLLKEDLDKQDIWDEWIKKCDKFREEHSNEYSNSIYRVILDAGDYAKRIWDGKM